MASGYRCVNFSDLCRLCSNTSSNQTQIFTNEELRKKIAECLPIQLDEKDKLPKGICTGCKEYVEIFSDFRKSSQNAQKMLEGCLNSSKIRNGGQVYIKDEAPVKKVLKPIQNPSPTKIVPNLNILATPSKKNVLAAPSQPDFLSTIMQAVGIQVRIIYVLLIIYLKIKYFRLVRRMPRTLRFPIKTFSNRHLFNRCRNTRSPSMAIP